MSEAGGPVAVAEGDATVAEGDATVAVAAVAAVAEGDASAEDEAEKIDVKLDCRRSGRLFTPEIRLFTPEMTVLK